MAYAQMVIIHDPAYTPPGPSTEYVDERSTGPLELGATVYRTSICYDDTEQVPAGGAGEITRYPMTVTTVERNRHQIREAAEAAIPTLRQIRDAPNLNDANQQAAIKELARNQIGIIRQAVIGDLTEAG